MNAQDSGFGVRGSDSGSSFSLRFVYRILRTDALKEETEAAK